MEKKSAGTCNESFSGGIPFPYGHKRYNDPFEWKCLNDEQRDVICDWWHRTMARDEAIASGKREADEIYENCTLIARIPLCVYLAFKIEPSFLSVLLIAPLLVFGFITGNTILASFLSGVALNTGFNKPSVWRYLITSVIVFLISFFVVTYK